jgi:hypothetical protein
MTSKKLPAKLAAGVRKLKEPAAPPASTPRPRRVSASQPPPHPGVPANTLSAGTLHPERVWPD